jgi:hypothetical protein
MQAAVRPLGMFGTDHSLSFFLEESLGRMKNAAMPTALRKNGFEFFFWSNDHSPAHIHVFKAGGEAKFNLEPPRGTGLHSRYESGRHQSGPSSGKAAPRPSSPSLSRS